MESAVKKKSKLDVAGTVVGPLAVMLMEICWVYPWLIWSREVSVFPFDKTPLHVLSLFAVIIASFAINRFIPSRGTAVRWGKIALVIAAVLLIMNFEYGGGYVIFSREWLSYLVQLIIDSFNNLHPSVAALTVLIYLAIRGIRIAISTTFALDVFRSFLFGLIAVILLIVIWALSMGRGSTEALISYAGLYITGFFFFGLAALAMGNFLNIRQKLLKQKSAPLSNGRWFSVLVTVIGGMVVIGVAIAALFSPGILSAITGTAGRLIYYLNYALEWIFVPFGYIVEFIWAIMTYLVNLIKSPETAEFLSPELGDIEGLEETAMSPNAGFDFMVVVKWIVFLILVAFVIWMIYRATKRFRTRDYDSGIEEFSESLWSWLGFGRDIRLFFSSLFDRWFGSRIHRMRTGLSRIGHSDELFRDDMSVREVYGRILRETKLSGRGRRNYETPFEYAGRLETSIPGVEREVDDITDLYVKVRYGESEVKSWETEHANVIWRLLYRVFHSSDKEKK